MKEILTRPLKQHNSAGSRVASFQYAAYVPHHGVQHLLRRAVRTIGRLRQHSNTHISVYSGLRDASHLARHVTTRFVGPQRPLNLAPAIEACPPKSATACSTARLIVCWISDTPASRGTGSSELFGGTTVVCVAVGVPLPCSFRSTLIVQADNPPAASIPIAATKRRPSPRAISCLAFNEHNHRVVTARAAGLSVGFLRAIHRVTTPGDRTVSVDQVSTRSTTR